MILKKLSSKDKLSRQNYFNVFLLCLFPIHLWAFFIFFEHAPWLTERGNGVALGVLSYFLLVALAETIGLFVLMLVAGYLLPINFSETKKVSFLSLTAWSISIGMIMAQILYAADLEATVLWSTVSAFIVIFVFLIYRLLNYRKFANMVEDLLGRFVVLSTIFLGLDLLAILNILFRNIF